MNHAGRSIVKCVAVATYLARQPSHKLHASSDALTARSWQHAMCVRGRGSPAKDWRAYRLPAFLRVIGLTGTEAHTRPPWVPGTQ